MATESDTLDEGVEARAVASPLRTAVPLELVSVDAQVAAAAAGARGSANAAGDADDGDAELVRRARGGHRQALDELAHRHRPSLHRYMVRRTGDHEVAEDLVQETLMRALAHLDGLDHPGAFAGWLYRIAARACADHHRRGPPTMAPIADVLPSDPRSRTPSAILAAAQRSEQLASRVASLPDSQRTVVELRHHAGLLCREIAVAMGTSVGAVTKWLSRAYDTLRGSLDE